MRGFPGFPAGVQRLIAVPEAFFSELLPAIDNLCELKVTLHCLWLLQRKSGNVRYVTLGELEQDGLLLSGLTDDEAIYPAISPLDALRDGLERATARGTLLQVTVDAPGRRQESLYLLNTERGRETVQRIERGEWVPPDAASDVRLRARRPNIFNLYEQNIGLIQPLIAEELKEAEQAYPPEWIEDAFRIAVTNNARSWAYVHAILERWTREGRRDQGAFKGRGERRRRSAMRT